MKEVKKIVFTESPSEFKSKLKKWRELSDYSKTLGKGNNTPETTRIPKVSAYKKRTSTLPEVSESNKSKLWTYYGIGKIEFHIKQLVSKLTNIQ